MKAGMKVTCLFVAIFCLCACATQSVTTIRAHPQMEEMVKPSMAISVIPLEVEVCQLTAGGISEKIDEWCSQARNNVVTAIQQELEGKPLLLIKPFHETLLSQKRKANLEETSALFDAVNASIINHTYGLADHQFPEKIENFDYSLGEEVSELTEGVDTILFLKGYELVPTAGKQAVETGKLILGALVGVAVPMNLGGTVVSMALVNAETGTIIWYNRDGGGKNADLRDPLATRNLIKRLLKDFPI